MWSIRYIVIYHKNIEDKGGKEIMKFPCKVTKVKRIYYTLDQELHTQIARFERRVSKVEAKEILENLDIEFDEILNIKPEYDLEFEIKLDDLEKYIK